MHLSRPSLKELVALGIYYLFGEDSTTNTFGIQLIPCKKTEPESRVCQS